MDNEQSKIIKVIGPRAFYDCCSLKDICYNGTMAQWDEIIIYKDALSLGVTVHCADDSRSLKTRASAIGFREKSKS